MLNTVGPGSWVRCIRATPVAEVRVGSIYKILSIHVAAGPCNGPPNHQCQKVAFFLAGVVAPYCSTCFAAIRPGGPAFLEMLLKAKAPTKPSTTLLPRNSE